MSEKRDWTQAITFVATIATLVAGLSSWHSINKQAEVSQRQAEIAQQGQVTDRFTRAVDQLAGDKLETKLGGIYALERIGRDSARDQPTVVEVLAAFVRQQSTMPGSPRITPEAQAAVTVIGHRDTKDDSRRLDLRGANLSGADLSGADLSGADLSGADLTEAAVTNVNLSRAVLSTAVLANARLNGVYLSHAKLYGADLTHAAFQGGDLTDALLGSADLTDTTFIGTNFTDADLTSADLTEADLRHVNLTRAVLWRATITGGTMLPPGWSDQVSGMP